jgi:uncharacterized membrane protein
MLIKLYLIALPVFLLLDGVWLGAIAKNLYRRQLGHLMTASPNWLAAIVFYLLFIVGLVALVLQPAVSKNSWQQALILGALFGLVSYATYDLTNLATLKDWPLSVTVIDLIWGTALSATVAVISFWLFSRLGQ